MRSWPRIAPALADQTPVLVIDDGDGLVEDHLGATREVAPWRRTARTGRDGAPLPEATGFAAATIRLPRSRPALEMALHLAGARVAPGAPVLVYGANDEGIKGAQRQVREVFGSVETVETKSHCRVLMGRRGEGPLRGALEDWTQTRTFDLQDGPLDLVSWPGVFAKGELDEGSRLLLSALPDPPSGAHVLDYGCGTGVLSAALLRRVPDLALQCIDADELAVRSTRHNVPAALVRWGASWGALPAYHRYDRIVSNPPIHQGRDRDYTVLKRIIETSGVRLTEGGELWMVVQRQVPAQVDLQLHWAEVELAAEDNRFRVWRAARPFS